MIGELISTAARPWWLRVLPYVAVVLVVLGGLYGAYRHGVNVTTDHYERVIAQSTADNAIALADAQEQARRTEKRHADQIADIDRTHQEALQNEITSHNRIVADLRSGALRLRDRFKCPAAAGGVSTPGTSTGSGDAAGEGGLRGEDAEFFVSEAHRANAVVLQLQACQAVVRADRGQNKADSEAALAEYKAAQREVERIKGQP